MEIRKCRKWTQWDTSEVVDLDPELFRNIKLINEDLLLFVPEFQGETEEDFLLYLNDLLDTVDDWIDDVDFDEETKNKILTLIYDIEWKEYSNTLDNGEDSWLEIGESDDSYRKTGGFNSHFSTEQF